MLVTLPLLVAHAVAAAAAERSAVRAKIDTGVVEGVAFGAPGRGTAFKGIPYGAPPTGECAGSRRGPPRLGAE